MTTLIKQIFTRLTSVFIILWCLAMIPGSMRNIGIENPSPIGQFINGNLPSLTPRAGEGSWKLVDAFPNLDFVAPIHLEQEPQSERMFVGEHIGRIMSFDKSNPTQKSVVLDIRNQTHLSGEAGLLSFAFHPRYGIDNRYLYVFYQYRPGGANRTYSRLSRFDVPAEGNTINNNTEQVLIHLYDRQNNHNAGALLFGPDGYLYISTGDEGGGNNNYGNSQALDDRLLGGVLRVDVDQDPDRSHPIRRQPRRLDGNDESFTANYYIPNDNPFLDPNGGILEEFYALGLRNPHAMTIDPVNNDIWIADVGQARREEINLLVKGANFQWGYREGDLGGPQGRPNPLIGTDEDPVYAYPHGNGDNCIIGGYIYRGNRLPSLKGKYIFADNGSGRMWSMDYNPGGAPEVEELLVANVGGGKQGICAFGTDSENEVYVLRFNGGNSGGGKIYKLDREQAASPEPPEFLSQTGIFNDLATLTPIDGIIPYEPNLPFWSDGASKQRWVAIPNDGSHDQAGEHITFAENDPWEFPRGTVFIKHFELPLDRRNPRQTRRLETRLMVHGEDGNYYGVTYRWLEDGSDAVLLQDGMDETIDIIDENGQNTTQTWKYPSRDECFTCHKEASGTVLGFNTRQLNGDLTYPESGLTANQLITLNHLGIFDQTLNEADIPDYLKTVSLDDPNASLELKARSYLDVNCGYCHNPNTGVLSEFDARLFTPLEQTNLINGNLRDNLGIDGSRVIVPGDTALSALYIRMNRAHDEIAMPPLAKNVIDQEGVQLIADWIFSMVAKDTQVIDFTKIPDKLTTDPPFELEATASSGLPVSFTLVSGPATLEGSTVTLSGDTGMVVIEAIQLGNDDFEAAEPVQDSFRVNLPPKQDQTITFNPIADKLTDDPPFTLEATATSGLPVNFTILSGPATLDGNTVRLSGETGTVTIEATQPGNEAYHPAQPVQQTFTVSMPINPGCPPVNFLEHDMSPYGFLQDRGSAVVSDEGDEIFLHHNAWKSINFPYLVTENTILEFEFRSTSLGELHAIGLDNNNWQTHEHTFKIYGTQQWGKNELEPYQGEDYQTYIVPLGTYYTGEFNRIFFIADHDSPEPTGNAYFRNVKVYEGDCEGMNIPEPQPDPFCFDTDLDELFIEAEHFSERTSRLNRNWETWADNAASNERGIIAPGQGLNTQLLNAGPGVDYQISFEATGTYYLYLRTQSPGTRDNSVHIGLDQKCLTCDGGLGVGKVSASWEWVNNIQETQEEVIVTIEDVGVHTLTLWMREDGIKIDKIALLKQPRTLSGLGPAENLRCNEAANNLEINRFMPAEAEIDFEESVLAPVVEVYPNPVSDRLHVLLSTLEDASLEASLYDMSGRKLYHQAVRTHSGISKQLNIPMEKLSRGVYILSVRSLSSNYPVINRRIEKK